jgi:hypothetical protein
MHLIMPWIGVLLTAVTLMQAIKQGFLSCEPLATANFPLVIPVLVILFLSLLFNLAVASISAFYIALHARSSERVDSTHSTCLLPQYLNLECMRNRLFTWKTRSPRSPSGSIPIRRTWTHELEHITGPVGMQATSEMMNDKRLLGSRRRSTVRSASA